MSKEQMKRKSERKYGVNYLLMKLKNMNYRNKEKWKISGFITTSRLRANENIKQHF